ncbi:MAG TPA: methyltransferase [Flavisolibacter sp.]|jgi:tRNA1Val (adenine37-N6)-methyltransferase|nr:methyltransferase [Flavisolibacter sp.]
MKVTTDSCLFGAWCAHELQTSKVQYPQLLDIGTGTGLLSLMAAQKNNSEIDAVEIDNEAAQQAGENVAASPWKERITVWNEDVGQWIPTKKYNVILSNPPFYEGDLKSVKQSKNLAHHDDGLKLEALLKFVKTYLAKDGFFYLLLPAKRWEYLETLLAELDLHLHKKVAVKQSIVHTPFRLMVQGSHSKGELFTGNISIKDNREKYTYEFSSLLREYYLHL